jgi:hypothetical protein
MLAFPLLYAVAGSGEDLVEPRTYTQSLQFFLSYLSLLAFMRIFLLLVLGFLASLPSGVFVHLFAI